MRLFHILLPTALVAGAQDYRGEAFVSGGAGLRGAEDLSSGGYGVWTAAGGYRLNDRWILKGEFAQHRPGPVNLFGGSLMREWDDQRARPFLEFGIGVGWWRQRWVSNIPGSMPGSVTMIESYDTQGYTAINFAAGLTYDFLDRYFVRPQLRVHLMGPIYLGVQPAVAVGARF